MAVRTSTRWFPVQLSKRMLTPIPFVCDSGKFSGSTLCFWNAYPETICASLASTVYLKLRKIVRRRHSYAFARSCRETLFKAAAYYAVTRDDWFFDRFLGIFKKRQRRNGHNLLTYSLSNLDDNIRFVIDQICSQILWLSFHSKGPSDPRRGSDKSIDRLFSDFSTSFNEVVTWELVCRRSVKLAAQAWITVKRNHSCTKTPIPSPGWLEYDASLSEPSFELFEELD